MAEGSRASTSNESLEASRPADSAGDPPSERHAVVLDLRLDGRVRARAAGSIAASDMARETKMQRHRCTVTEG